MRDLAIVRALAHISDFTGNAFPGGPVRCLGTGECVGNLVQQHLMDFVIIELGREIPRDRNRS